MRKEKTSSEEDYVEEDKRRKRAKEAEARKEDLKMAVSEIRKTEVATIVPQKEEKHIKVPIVSQEPPEFRFKELEIDEQITRVEKERRRLSLPVLELQGPPLMLAEAKVDNEISRIEKRRELVNIPIVRLRALPKVLELISEFDAEVIRPKPLPLPKVKVPIYRKSALISPKSVLDDFDLSINQQLREHLEEKEKPQVTPSIRTEPVEVGVPSLGEGEEEEIPEFIELAFSEDGGKIRGKGPWIILMKDFEDDSHVSLLETLCARIYREKEGGEPEAVKIQRIDEMSKKEIEKWMKPSHKIFTINLDHTEKEKKTWLEIDEDRLWERLEETYLGKIGFIIFATRDEETFEHYKELLNRINLKAQLRLNVVALRSAKLPWELTRLVSGMVSLGSVEPIVGIEKRAKTPIGATFDSILNEAQKRFDQILQAVKEEEKGLFKSATNRNRGQIEGKERESDLHFDIKVFLVRYLTHELRKQGLPLKSREEVMEKIETEKGVASPVPDVQVGSEAYEVETLFGEGENADKKIDLTIDKYDGTGIGRVNIVMDNIGFLMHVRDLKMKKEQFKNKKFGVEFYTLDLQNKRLASLSEVVKKLRKLRIET